MKCRHIWIHFDRNDCPPEFYARRVCHDCKLDMGFEIHDSEKTIFGFAKRLMREGKLTVWESAMVTAFKDVVTLSAGQKKIIKRIVDEKSLEISQHDEGRKECRLIASKKERAENGNSPPGSGLT